MRTRTIGKKIVSGRHRKNDLTLSLLFRLAFKHNHSFSKKMIKKIIFNLVPMVEDLIAGEMSEAGVGAIMHDGWSQFGTHYVALLAQYNRNIKQRIGKTSTTATMTANVLLAIRPMGAVSSLEDDQDDELPELEKLSEMEEDQDEDDEIATTFTVEVHANFFKEVFKKYGLDVEKWAVCQVRV